VFIAIGLLAALSTAYDYFTKKYRLPSKQILKSFSVTQNFKDLLKINESESMINCIDGLKTLSGNGKIRSQSKSILVLQLSL
jgi:hypothetical protein